MLEMSDGLPGLGSLEVGLLAAVLPQLLNGLGFQARRALPFFRSKRFLARGISLRYCGSHPAWATGIIHI